MTARRSTFVAPCRAVAAYLAASALACVSSKDLDSIETQLQEIQVQVLRLQKQSPSKTEVAALESTLSDQLQDLLETEAQIQADIRGLSGQIEQLEDKLEDTHFRIAQLAQQIAATNQELQVIRTAAEEARATVSRPAPPALGTTDPQALYDTAYNDYLQGNYDLAILGFHQYAEKFKNTELADNATYWIGECYYRQGQFQKAIEQYDGVLEIFERSDRTPSALLKKGYAFLELGQRAQGVVQLQRVLRDHTATDEAHLARQRLEELGVPDDVLEDGGP